MSWMEENNYNEKQQEKLEKGGGFDRLVTVVCGWFYRVMSW
ncbi:MAG: hypothetical protein ACXQT4_03245 [Methanotrichaceae archaeon]